MVVGRLTLVKWECQMKIPDRWRPPEGEKPLSMRVGEIQRLLTLRAILSQEPDSQLTDASELLTEMKYALARSEAERNFYMALLQDTKSCETCNGYRCSQCKNKSEYRLIQYGDLDFKYGDDEL
jgi:hypothetical protein